jgi:hypothetical protein
VAHFRVSRAAALDYIDPAKRLKFVYRIGNASSADAVSLYVAVGANQTPILKPAVSQVL